MRRRLDTGEGVIGAAGVDLSVLSHLPLSALTSTRSLRAIHTALFGDLRQTARFADRTLYRLANDPKAMRELDAAARQVIRDAARDALPGDFRHIVGGLRRGKFNYAVKHGLSEFRLDSALNVSEQMEVAVDRLGTSTNIVNVKANRDKPMKLEVTNKLGVAGDHVRITVDRIPLSAAAGLQLNLKPGLGGLELISSGEKVDARVEIRAVIDRKPLRRTFQLPVEGGARLKLSNVLSQRTLGVSRIDNLLGPARDAKILMSSV